MPQGAPKMPPRAPFGGPEPPPESPRCPQEASQTFQITPQPLQRSIFVAKRTKTQALLQIFSKYENAQTPRKMHGFEHVQMASNALFGHQKWPQEAPRSPPRDPMTPPRRPQDVSHAHQNVSLRLPRGPRRPETFQDAANAYGDIPNETRFPSLASQVSSAAPKSVKKHWFLQGFWLFGPSKKCKKGGGPKNGPQEASKTLFGPQKWPQEAPKRRPGGAQDAPRRPQEGPKRALGAPEPPPGAPKTPPGPPRSLPSALEAVFFEAKLPKTRKCQKPL